jgi:Uma2 family endonuclease
MTATEENYMDTLELRLTAAQFARLPALRDGSQRELIRGVVALLPAPGFRHRFYQGNAYTLLWEFADNTRFGIVTADANFPTGQDPDTVRGTDVGYWTVARLPLDTDLIGPPPVVPDLSVEVVSNTKKLAEARERMTEHLASGVRMVWIVEPEYHTVTVYRTPDEGRILHEMATLHGEDVLPGFQCRVADFFA